MLVDVIANEHNDVAFCASTLKLPLNLSGGLQKALQEQYVLRSGGLDGPALIEVIQKYPYSLFPARSHVATQCVTQLPDIGTVDELCNFGCPFDRAGLRPASNDTVH